MNAEKCEGLLALRARPCERLFSRPSVNRFMQMVSPLFSGCPISVVTACRKNPFPSPTLSCIGILRSRAGSPNAHMLRKDYVKTAFDVREKSRESCKRQVAIVSGLVGAGSTDLERGAAVYEELHAGDKIRFVGYEEQCCIGHVPGRAHLVSQRHAGIALRCDL